MRSLIVVCLLLPLLVKGKSVLDDTFEEFEKENDEKAAFEKDKAHAIKNNADPNKTHKETLYPGISELTDDEFKKDKLGELQPIVDESRALGGMPGPGFINNGL